MGAPPKAPIFYCTKSFRHKKFVLELNFCDNKLNRYLYL